MVKPISGPPRPAVAPHGFGDRVRGEEAGRLWMYEAVPPRQDLPAEKVLKRVRRIQEALGGLSERLCAYFVPDIDPNETGFGERPEAPTDWMDARTYAELLQEKLGGETVICRSSVAHAEPAHVTWLHECWEKHFHAVVAVGGDSRRKSFPGPTPERFAELARDLRGEHAVNLAVGGICLPQRGMVDRYGEASFQPDPLLEPRRMLAKNAQGVEFFMMQIQFEATDALRVAEGYGRLCAEQGRRPHRIFVGLAPVTDPRDLDFMKYLGVNLPPAALERIGTDPATMGERSISYVVDVMRQVQDRLNPALRVPLDVCIECTAPRNVNAAADLLGRLIESAGT